MSAPIIFGWFSLRVNHLKKQKPVISNFPTLPNSTVPTPRIVLDAKRGDIGSTSEAYATSAFSTLACDSITASPYLGLLGDLGGWVSDRKGAERSRGLLENEGYFRRYFQKNEIGSMSVLANAFFLVVYWGVCRGVFFKELRLWCAIIMVRLEDKCLLVIAVPLHVHYFADPLFLHVLSAEVEMACNHFWRMLPEAFGCCAKPPTQAPSSWKEHGKPWVYDMSNEQKFQVIGVK